MPRALKLVGDQHSAEFDELRRQFNNLLIVLHNIAASVDGGDVTADEAFTVLKATLESGVDESLTSVDGGSNDYSGTELELVGIKGNKHPRRPRMEGTVLMDSTTES